jgi:hypothetical protein
MRIRVLTLGFTILLTCVIPLTASVANVFVTQTQAGGNTGADCSNAHGMAFFNTVANWGAGAAQIGPDTTVHLCGTFTGAAGVTLLTFQAGGTVGHPVTVLFEPRAVLQAPYFPPTGAINLNGFSNITIDGGHACGEIDGVLVECNGLIQNTLNGSRGAVCPGGACSNQKHISSAVRESGTPSNVEIRNIAIKNMYIRVPTFFPLASISESGTTVTAITSVPNTFRARDTVNFVGVSTSGYNNDSTCTNVSIVNSSTFTCTFGVSGLTSGTGGQTALALDGEQVWSIYFSRGGNGSWSHIKIHNCVVWNASENITLDYGTNNIDDIQIYNNNTQDAHWQIAVVSGDFRNGNQPTTATNIQIHDNEIYNFQNWTIPASDFHTDGIFVWNESVGSTIDGNIYNNYLHGDLTGGQVFSSATAFITAEHGARFSIFNNRVDSTCSGLNPTRGCAADIWLLGGGPDEIYNNTLTGVAGAGAGIKVNTVKGPNTFRNNVLQNLTSYISIQPDNWTLVDSDFNIAFNVNQWICNNSAVGFFCDSLTQYQARTGGTGPKDVHSLTGNPKLDAADRLQTGSQAIKLGTNLMGVGIIPLRADAVGNARPEGIILWDAGAFNFMPVELRPIPPANLRVTDLQ